MAEMAVTALVPWFGGKRTLADVGIYAATVSLARLAARRKVNP